jgi:hypothetical protein
METDLEGRESEIRTGTRKAKKKLLEGVGLLLLGLGIAGTLVPLLQGKPLRHPVWGIIEVLSFLFGLAVFILPKGGLRFFHGLFGGIEHIQADSLEFGHRIRIRYQSEIDQLTNLGFAPIFFFGWAFPLIRLLLLFPALVCLMMWFKREVMGILDGTKILVVNPIFISSRSDAFAEASGLGVKLCTAFQDGTILVSKNYGDDHESHEAAVVIHTYKNASIGETWDQHQRGVQLLQTGRNRAKCQNSFQAFDEIERKVTVARI